MSHCVLCEAEATGKSKYCREHAREARAAWQLMLQEKSAERASRVQTFESLAKQAHAAGMAAGTACIPIPMGVGQPMPDGSVKLIEVVEDGACGFAWVTIRPGNSSFSIWAKKAGIASRAYGGGVMVWVGGFNQSMARKEAYARAYAEVLTAYGIKAYSGSRMD